MYKPAPSQSGSDWHRDFSMPQYAAGLPLSANAILSALMDQLPGRATFRACASLAPILPTLADRLPKGSRTACSSRLRRAYAAHVPHHQTETEYPAKKMSDQTRLRFHSASA